MMDVVWSVSAWYWGPMAVVMYFRFRPRLGRKKSQPFRPQFAGVRVGLIRLDGLDPWAIASAFAGQSGGVLAFVAASSNQAQGASPLESTRMYMRIGERRQNPGPPRSGVEHS